MRLEVIQSYILAGKLLHIITIIELFAIGLIVPYIADMETGNSYFLIGLKNYLIIFLVSLPLFSQMDARSRFQNYKQIKDQIYFYGYSERILKPVLKSRCQRDAAWLSAKELGFGKECKQYFRTNGYRWFHLFPDFLFQKPQFLFTGYFWKTTFFTPRYLPKVDYYALESPAGIIKVTENEPGTAQ